MLYDSCYPKLAKLIAIGGDESQAEDVFQEGLMILYDNLMANKFEQRSSLSTYLIGICKNIWLMRLRKQKVVLTNQPIEDHSATEEVAVNEEQLETLLGRLDKGCEAILKAFYYEMKPWEEIQEQFELGSNQAARNKKSLCLKKLMKIIKDSGLNYESFLQ